MFSRIFLFFGVSGISQYYPSDHLPGASPAEIQYVILDQGDRVQSATRFMDHGQVDLAIRWPTKGSTMMTKQWILGFMNFQKDRRVGHLENMGKP